MTKDKSISETSSTQSQPETSSPPAAKPLSGPQQATLNAITSAESAWEGPTDFRTVVHPFLRLALWRVNDRRHVALSMMAPVVEVIDALAYALVAADAESVSRFHAVAEKVLEFKDMEEHQRFDLSRRPSLRNEKLDDLREIWILHAEEMVKRGEPNRTIARWCAELMSMWRVSEKNDALTIDDRAARILDAFSEMESATIAEKVDSALQALGAAPKRPSRGRQKKSLAKGALTRVLEKDFPCSKTDDSVKRLSQVAIDFLRAKYSACLFHAASIDDVAEVERLVSSTADWSASSLADRALEALWNARAAEASKRKTQRH